MDGNHWDIFWFLRPRMLLGYFIAGLIISLVCVGIILIAPGEGTTSSQVPAAVEITSAPTSTPVLATPTIIPSPTVPSNVPPPPAPGVITIGSYVQISGTGGDGLRLRVEPGLDSVIRIVGSEAEVFLVSDGPIEMDGYTWWYLVGPFDANRHGWAVSNFLEVVQNP